MARPAADAQVLTNDPERKPMEKDNDDDSKRNQESKQELELDNQIHDDVLSWTAARLLALPLEVSAFQTEKPFIGPAGEKRRRAPRISST